MKIKIIILIWVVDMKVVTDEASLRQEFRVSTGRNPRKSIKNPP